MVRRSAPSSSRWVHIVTKGVRMNIFLEAARWAASLQRSRPPWCRSAYHRYASGCLETARRLACAVIRASAHVAPRVVLAEHHIPVFAPLAAWT